MERLQILVTPEQRRRLTMLARARGTAVTALIREAIDEAFPEASDAATRQAAARTLLDRHVPFISPDELDRTLDDRFDVPA
jgi:predicted DNA-binding protein